MDIAKTLHNNLLHQDFEDAGALLSALSECQSIARNYAKLENGIAVLSDLVSNKSYIFYGALAEMLALARGNTEKEIDSIWEEDILGCIIPGDLQAKYAVEFRFFQLLKQLPIKERVNYHANIRLRMRNGAGIIIPVIHRIFYLYSLPNGSLGLTLCLYQVDYSQQGRESQDNFIVNTANAELIRMPLSQANGLLSEREREVLKCIRQGKMSKEIAGILKISVNTVNRHRQNILAKLMVDNSMEACRVAELMQLI